MSEHNHTPGPWVVDWSHTGEVVRVGPEHGNIVANVYARKHVRENGARSGNAQDVTEGRANARLIAAAPDLLAAVEGLLDALPSATTHPAIAAARAAIARAVQS